MDKFESLEKCRKIENLKCKKMKTCQIKNLTKSKNLCEVKKKTEKIGNFENVNKNVKI